MGIKQSTFDNDVWVFLSHSNKDYESVRLLRNMLEEEGYRPIMFFLLSLSDDDEIDSLIKREIDSRKLFILCDSENARNSAWVQKEVEYIKHSRRYYQTIRLDEPMESIKEQILRFRRDSTIYLFYSKESRTLFPIIRKALQKDMGCKVYDWHDEFNRLGIKEAIDMALKNGYVFFLMPEGEPLTEFSMEDVRYALGHELSSRACLLKNAETDTYSPEVVNYHVHNGEIVFDEKKLYLHVMIERIKEGAERREPVSLYWLACHNLQYDARYEFSIHADSFRKYTLNLAWEAAEAGFAPAAQLYKDIYDDILQAYPEDFKDNPAYASEARNRLHTLFPDES